MGSINTILNGLIAPFTGVIVAAANALTKGLQWFVVNPLYTIIGFYVIMVAWRGGSFKLGSKASTEVKK